MSGYFLLVGGSMARIAFKPGDDYALKLSKLATNSEEIAKKAIFEGAKIVADQIRDNLEGVLSPEATGDLIASFGVTPIEKDKDGNWNAKIGFDGYDRDGVPNQLKARVLESGSSKQKKRPYIRPAVTKTRKKVLKKMEEVIDKEIKKLDL